MRSTFLRVLVACAAFAVGVFIGSIYRYTQQPRCLAQPSSTAEAPAPSQTPSIEQPIKTYPEDLGIGPFDIAFFIDDHPEADLARLWERLKITADDTYFSSSGVCGRCKASTFQYDLDNDSTDEVVVQIKSHFGEAYRYLVFERSQDPKLLGHIDVWAKYPPLDPFVLASNGQPWLVVQSTAGTGSGLGAWRDTVYHVSDRGVRPVASYLGRVNQNGEPTFPAKEFIGRPVSCEMKGGRVILTVAYTVEYSEFGADGTPLFTKRQKAVLVGSLANGASFLDAAQSEMSRDEFESIYNFDSMSAEEFLKFNRSELRTIAAGNNEKKKKWLNGFLTTCDDSLIKRELLGLLGQD